MNLSFHLPLPSCRGWSTLAGSTTVAASRGATQGVRRHTRAVSGHRRRARSPRSRRSPLASAPRGPPAVARDPAELVEQVDRPLAEARDGVPLLVERLREVRVQPEPVPAREL